MRVLLATRSVLGAALILSASAEGQTLVAEDDAYPAVEGQMMEVDDPGVLDNDTLDGGKLPPTAEAVLVGGASFGFLDCEPDPGVLELCPDGSFTYLPDPGFIGIDSFTYRVIDGGNASNVATVTLTVTACETTGVVTVCWLETSYLQMLAELGFGSFQEGFEDDTAWGSARSPDTQPVVSSQGIDWAPNNSVSGITTGMGPARTGLWGVYELPHGDPTGALLDPLRDGFTGTWTGAGSLVGVGGWLTSNTGGAQVRFALDGVPAPGFPDPTVTSAFKFFGVITTAGLTAFEFFETEGVVEDQEFIFADDFTVGTTVFIFADDFETGDTSRWSGSTP